MGVQVSYGATRRIVTQLQITDPFDVDLQIGSIETIKDWVVNHYDNLSVAMHFTTRTGGNFTNYIVKSSPYVTVKFDDATPVIGSDVMKIMYVKKIVDERDGTY